MAKSPPKTTVSVTPGQNEPVNHILKFEDLVQRAKQGAAKPARTRAAMPAKRREQLDAVQRLAAELETMLRTIRAATPDEPPASRARGAPRRKRKS
ncbi:MAG: hypothetical protein ACXW29_13360 [Thermoanaerobaculia bacterium]